MRGCAGDQRARAVCGHRDEAGMWGRDGIWLEVEVVEFGVGE